MKLVYRVLSVALLTLALFTCELTPTSEQWSAVTLSLYGTALPGIDVTVTVETDVEGALTPYTVQDADLPWQYHQFSFMKDYSIQITAPAEPLPASGTTTADSSPYNTGTDIVYKITDSSVLTDFTTDAARHDIIRNDSAVPPVSVRIYGVIDAHNLYIYEDDSGQNIFDPTTYPFPVAYTILPVHDLWLRSIVIDSDNNRSETIHHQQEPTVDLQITD
jgi:hypothetical protein